MTRAELKEAAKSQIKGNIGILLIMMILVAVVAAVPVVGAVLSPGLSLSMVMIYLNLTYGDEPKLEDLLGGVKMLGKAWCLSLLIGIFTFLWALLLYIPGIIKALSYSMSYYILADNPDMTAREALNESKRITQGHKGEIFVLGLSFIGWILLTAVTLGIAGIYTVPYMQTTMANFYQSIKAPVVYVEGPEIP